MATQTKPVNKTAEVRKLLANRPNLTAPKVVEILAKRNIFVSPSLVSNIKSAIKAHAQTNTTPDPENKDQAGPMPGPVPVEPNDMNGDADVTAHVMRASDVPDFLASMGLPPPPPGLLDAIAERMAGVRDPRTPRRRAPSTVEIIGRVRALADDVGGMRELGLLVASLA